MMWLGSGCSDGSAKEAARPVGECDPGRSQSPHSTAAVQTARSTGIINRAEGRWGRKVEACCPNQSNAAPQVPIRLCVAAKRAFGTTRRDPRAANPRA